MFVVLVSHRMLLHKEDKVMGCYSQFRLYLRVKDVVTTHTTTMELETTTKTTTETSTTQQTSTQMSNTPATTKDNNVKPGLHKEDKVMGCYSQFRLYLRVK
jgi:TfoX/Sxy family transcriptional regulator of competence genes